MIIDVEQIQRDVEEGRRRHLLHATSARGEVMTSTAPPAAAAGKCPGLHAGRIRTGGYEHCECARLYAELQVEHEMKCASYETTSREYRALADERDALVQAQQERDIARETLHRIYDRQQRASQANPTPYAEVGCKHREQLERCAIRCSHDECGHAEMLAKALRDADAATGDVLDTTERDRFWGLLWGHVWLYRNERRIENCPLLSRDKKRNLLIITLGRWEILIWGRVALPPDRA